MRYVSRNLRQGFNSRVHRINKVLSLAAAVAAVPLLGTTGKAVAATWNDPTAVSPSITGVGTTSFTSTVALKDGDVVKDTVAGAGLTANLNYYVVGVGSTPSFTIKLSTSPGGAFNVTPAATTATTIQADDWNISANWTGPVPNGVGAVANISTNVNTAEIAIDKDTTIGSLNFSGASNSLTLVSTVTGNAGPWATLDFATTVGTPEITVSGGNSLNFSDETSTVQASTSSGNADGKLIIAGNQGLTIDNQNPIQGVSSTGAVSSPGAVRFGYQIDWSQFSGTLTLSEGAFASVLAGSSHGVSPLPMNSDVVLGVGSETAQLEMLANSGPAYIRGLDGDSESTVINDGASGGPSLTLGSYSVPSDSYTFNGSMGTPIVAGVSGTTPGNLRIIKIGGSTQTLTGNLNLSNGNVLTLNDGVLSLGTTGTIGTASGPGQASLPAGANGATQMVYSHNAEFKMVGTSANPRSQVLGELVQSDGTGSGSTYASSSNGLSTYTLVADPAQPITLTFSSLGLRNLNTASTDTNADGQSSLYRGTNLGTAAPGTNGVANILFTTAPFSAGQFALANTTSAAVLKGALADTSATGTGAGFATYDAVNGIRVLNSSEQDLNNYPLANSATNERLNLSGPAAITGVTTQTLQLDNQSGTAQVVTNTGTALNASSGILLSGTSAITLTGGGITGTASADNEDVVIHSTDTAGVNIGISITNTGATSKPGWITFDGPSNVAVTGPLSVGNSGGLAFNGTGTTSLQSSITSSSNIAVNQGLVQLAPGVTLNNASNLLVAAAGTFDLNNQSATFSALNTNVLYNNSGLNLAGGVITNSGGTLVNMTLSGTTAGTFPGTISGNLNLVVSKTNGTTVATQVLNGPNTYTGSTLVNAGSSLDIGRYGTLPSTTVVTVGDSASTPTTGFLLLGDSSSSDIDGPARVTISGLFAGTAAGNAVEGNNPSDSVLTVNYANTSTPDTYTGILGNTSATNASPGSLNNITLIKSGPGTMVLGGSSATSNFYTGGTQINGGTLSIAADDKIGGLGSVIGGTPASPISAIANNIILNNGTLQATSSFALQSLRGIGIGSETGASGATGTIDVAGAGTTLSYGGVIASSGNTGTNNFTKIGLGTLVLGGVNTYNGITTVSNGALNVTGSLANNSSANVYVATDPDGVFGTADDITITRTALGSYNGLGSTEVGALASAADIKQGQNSSGSDTGVTMQWRPRLTSETNGSTPPLPAGATQLDADVLNLTGMVNSGAASGQTDPYALQMTYSSSLVPTAGALAASGNLYLAYLNASAGPQWQNAVLGDFGSGSSVTTDFLGSYAAFAAANGITDGNVGNFLGSWGVDVADNEVWAVVDHNSQFSVLSTVAVPEPASISFLAAGAVGLLARRRRRNAR